MRQTSIWALFILFGIGCRLIVSTEASAPATSETVCQPPRLLNVDDNGKPAQLRVGLVFCLPDVAGGTL